MPTFTLPQPVSQNISRARSLFKRNDHIRGIEALKLSMELYFTAKPMGKAKYEAAVLLQECIREMNSQPKIQELMRSLTNSKASGIPYAPGQEEKFYKLLTIINKAITKIEQLKQDDQTEQETIRKKELLLKWRECLAAKDLAKGKVALRLLAEEFGKEEPELYYKVAEAMIGANLLQDALPFLEKSIEVLPKNAKAYSAATKCYIKIMEYQKAEQVYLKALKQFGYHPTTLLNLAKLYAKWNKRDKAYEAAKGVINKDPKNAEAREIMERFG